MVSIIDGELELEGADAAANAALRSLGTEELGVGACDRDDRLDERLLEELVDKVLRAVGD
jgi:hypothetical protein